MQHLDESFLAELDRLEAVGRMQDLDFASVVARIATDRFCALTAPSRLDIDRYVSVMDRALERATPEEAAKVAERIAGRSDIPERLLWRLTLCGAQAAMIALRAAPCPSARLLLARVESGDVAEASVVASRPDLERGIVMAIVRRTEHEPMRALAANPSAPLDRGIMLALVQRGRFDPPLARAVLARSGGGMDAAPLFLDASADMRRAFILQAQKDALGVAAGRGATLEAIRGHALAAARAGNARAFATHIARVLRTGRATLDRMIDDRTGEPLALLLAALGADVAQSLDAMSMLRPALQPESDAGVMLALSLEARAATRLVQAIVHGTAHAPAPPREYARPPVRPQQTGTVLAQQAELLSKLSRG